MNQRLYQWISVVTIVIIGVIHLSMVSLEYDENPFMGILFGLNFIAALIASVGIYRGEIWGWPLGTMIAAGSMLGYVLSRTVGLPGMEVITWLQPLGILSLVVEGVFIFLVAERNSWAAAGRLT